MDVGSNVEEAERVEDHDLSGLTHTWAAYHSHFFSPEVKEKNGKGKHAIAFSAG